MSAGAPSHTLPQQGERSPTGGCARQFVELQRCAGSVVIDDSVNHDIGGDIGHDRIVTEDIPHAGDVLKEDVTQLVQDYSRHLLFVQGLHELGIEHESFAVRRRSGDGFLFAPGGIKEQGPEERGFLQQLDPGLGHALFE